MFVCLACVFGHYVYAGGHGGQKKALNLLELELQVVMSCLTWELGTKLWSSATSVSALTKAISTATDMLI